jgi:hypothetical protein
MPTLTIEYRDDRERLLLEQALGYLGHLRQVAQTAPAGTVLEACEQVALTKGRELLRTTLATSLESRLATDEQKGGPPAPAPRRTLPIPRGATPGPS